MTGAMEWISNFLYAAMLAGVRLYGTLGEILTKGGNVSLGVEGMMYMGAVFGFMGALYHPGTAAAAALLFAFLGGLRAGIRVPDSDAEGEPKRSGSDADDLRHRLANLLGTNASGSGAMVSDSIKAIFRPLDMGALTALPYVGKLLFNHSILTYLGIVLAVGAGWYLNHTRKGLNLRAVGETPCRRTRRA